jgi:NAD(P)-dependent dehydrogenase (short-subunit alcohol dehydrogenase family)
VAIVARNKADLEATARELAAETNRRIVPLAADVTSKEQVDRMVAEAAQQLGGLHILVNSGSALGGSATAPPGPRPNRYGEAPAARGQSPKRYWPPPECPLVTAQQNQ